MLPDEERQGPVIRDRRRIDPATGQIRDTGEPGPQHRGPGTPGGQPRPGRHSASQPGGVGSGGQGAGGQRGGQRAGENPAAGGARPGGTRPGDGPLTSHTGPAREAPGSYRSFPGGTTGGTGQDQGDSAIGKAEAAAAEAAAKLAERTADLQRLQAEYANYRKRVERDRLAVREQALANVLSELLPVLDDIGRAREHGELTGGFKSVADSLEGTTVKLGLTSYGENGEPFDPTLHEALMHSYSADVTEPTCVQILQPGYRVGERIIRPARVSVAEPAGEGGGTEEAAEPGQAEHPNAPGPARNGDTQHHQPGIGDVPPGRPDGAGS